MLTYAGFAGLANTLGRHRRRHPARVPRPGWTGGAIAATVVAAATLAAALPQAASEVAADLAFVLTIPFMSTLLPGVARRRPLPGRPSRQGRATRVVLANDITAASTVGR